VENRKMNQLEPSSELVDVVVVGAGFAGLYGLIHFRELGLTVQGFEAGEGVGGVWFWNRYPGARCDVQSIDYSFSFDQTLEQEWVWKERYASQPEILAYLRHVTARYELEPLIRFGTRVAGLRWDESIGRWHVQPDQGEPVSARFVVLATGPLSAMLEPQIAGREDFDGQILYTARWPQEPVDLHGKRVGVIGTGASGIQSTPLIADAAKELVVFQRTANFTIPTLIPALTDEELASVKRTYAERRQISRRSRTGYPERGKNIGAFQVSEAERNTTYEDAWTFGGVQFARVFNDQLTDQASNRAASDFVRAKIRSIVRDPATADALTPTHPIGSRRICTDQGYYASFNRPNVQLVDLRKDPIEQITPTGIRTRSAEIDLDVLIFATGFDAMTGAVLKVDIVGRDGRRLRDAWAEGPRTLLGLMTAGFPNLFMTTGAGSSSVLANMVLHSEQHINWIGNCISWLDERGEGAIEPTVEAETAWGQTILETAAGSVLAEGDSWYLGGNVEGKPHVFMAFAGGFAAYADICDRIAAESYEGFVTMSASTEKRAISVRA
jgi:cation diffusion facilitator CzcD-associated flavoprotein CzcO